jgi:hypothetical protein
MLGMIQTGDKETPPSKLCGNQASAVVHESKCFTDLFTDARAFRGRCTGSQPVRYSWNTQTISEALAGARNR